MPKKQRNNYLKQLQGTSSGNKAAGTNVANTKSSVNEKLSELRKLGGKDAAKKKAELAESATNHKSVHPSLKGILGIAESAPPKPKRAARVRLPNRTPGPAPPASWTKTPGWTRSLALRTGQRRFRRNGTTDIDRNRPEKLGRFALLSSIDDDDDYNRRPGSLVHFALKTAAENWDMFDEEDLPMLAELPLRLRLKLLSYLGFYGPAIDINTLDALTSGTEPLSHLDLAGLIGSDGLSIPRLTKLAKEQKPMPQSAESTTDAVVESWDQDSSFEAALSMSIPEARFSSLTHLSLSHPPPGVSWRDLLALSRHTPSLAHLSLAYWQRPTLTPNLATATVSSQHSPDVHAGGSHYYSALDQDMYEPAAIIRQLSNNLLSLRWLDLEGCTDWCAALSFVWNSDAATNDVDDTWAQQSTTTSIWAGNWKNFSYLNLSQGWVPNIATLHLLPRQQMSSFRKALLDKFTEQVGLAQLGLEQESDNMSLVAQRKAQIWSEVEEQAMRVGRDINNLRRSEHVKYMDVDHGWYVQ
ncbi:hypothetical protein CB0940_08885 [Cercospora beticola]|uniref:Tafazzin n=1 Tax=Cercospora beticola TaxID=122368 RepID=A0A2G5HQ35_CERBT|nr:hypothetical protein CB0940_08885 [Cercospora beticola]PIA94651.1 hypothetical protein CB0940_08885 [Cercospora beticola]WPB05479.1 hypothetical protein RHO25_010131 [Cercospora beticola]